MKYIPRPGSGLSKDQAEVAGKSLSRLCNGTRVLKPQRIVEVAKREAHPLHEFFEWNNSLAAEKYRVHQARMLLSNILIQVETDDGQIEYRAFNNVRVEYVNGDGETEKKRGYVSVKTVLSTQDMMDQVLRDARRELRYWAKEIGKYEKLGRVAGMLKELLKEIEKEL